MKAPLKVLVIDPSDLGRACTAAVLETKPGLDVVSSASVGSHAGGFIPDIILFQSSDTPPATSTLTAEMAQASRQWPATPVLVVADYSDEQQMIATVRAGAQGLLTSNTSVLCMESAIMLLVNDMGVYPRKLAAYLHGHAEGDPASPARIEGQQPFEIGRLNTLTRRQQDVLELLALGSSNKAIAQRLHISESTVKVHIRAIMAQNGASNRTQIVAHFLRGSGNEH